MECSRMSRAVLVCIGIAVCVLCGACSSLPGPPDEVFDRHNQAARDLEAGNRYFREARYDIALEFYTLALDSAEALDDGEGQVTALNSIGKTFFLAGEKDKAGDYYTRAWSRAENSGNPLAILQTANNIGELEISRGESAKALDSYRKALDAGGKEASKTVELAVLYHNMGACLRDRGDFAVARENVERAAGMNRSAKRFSELASNYYMLSSIAFRENNFDAARQYALEALDYDKRMENSLGIAQDLLALGSIEEKTGETARAHDAYKRAFFVYRSLQHAGGMRRSLEKLMLTSQTLNLKEETEQYREAYGHLQTKTE